MSNLKKYTFCSPDDAAACECSVVESIDGQWVKFEDHVESLSKAHNSAMDAIAALRDCIGIADLFTKNGSLLPEAMLSAFVHAKQVLQQHQ